MWNTFCYGDGNLSSRGGAAFTNPSQSAISQWYWVCTPCRMVLTRGTAVFVPGVLELMYGRISHQGIGPYPRRVALAPRTPANQRSVKGVGFPHRAGWYRPGEPPFSSPVRWSCRCGERLLIRGGTLSSSIFPGWRWLHEPQPISTPRVQLGLPRRAGQYQL